MLSRLLTLAAIATSSTAAAPAAVSTVPPEIISVCAADLKEKMTEGQTGKRPASLDLYLAAKGLNGTRGSEVRRLCDAFDAGVVFALVAIPQPTPTEAEPEIPNDPSARTI